MMAVDLKELPQHRTRIAASKTVGTECEVPPADMCSDQFGVSPDIICRDDDGRLPNVMASYSKDRFS